MDFVCWICKGPADCREHMTKKSDLKSIFGKIERGSRLYFCNNSGKTDFIQSLNSNILKWPKNICTKCNSTLSQPYDKSWEIMSECLRKLCESPGRPHRISMARLFHGEYRKHMINCQLYFIKHLGCAINHPIVLKKPEENQVVSNQIDHLNAYRDVSECFAKSLIQAKARSDVYLRFAFINKIGPHKNVGSTELGCIYDGFTKKIATVSIIQYLDRFAINVFYVRNGYSNPAIRSAWSPLSNMKEITFHTF